MPALAYALVVTAVSLLTATARPEGGLRGAVEAPPGPPETLKHQVIADLKRRILRELNLPRAPTGNLTQGMSSDVVKMLIDDEEALNEGTRENVIVHANNRNISCEVGSETSHCRKLEFSVPADLESVVSVRARFHKRSPARRPLSLALYPESGAAEPLLTIRDAAGSESGWVTFELPKTLALQREDDGHLRCRVEVEGTDVDTEGDRRPFLVVTKHLEVQQQRRRRAVSSSSNENCTCCTENHHITMEEIGWHNWVISPTEMDIKVCKGQCIENQGSFTLNYQRIMNSFYKINTTRPKPKCNSWTPQCMPDQYESMRMIYHGSDGTKYDHNISNMKIKSCRCM